MSRAVWIAFGFGALALAVPAVAYAVSKRRAGGDPELEAVVAMVVAENGITSPARAHQLVAESFWRNVRASGRTPRQILAGNGGALAPWPTATAYKASLARARVDLAARPEAAAVVVEAVKAARESELAPGGTNWTHGAAPYQPWLEKGYAVVASERVASEKRPYLWVYRRPA